MGRTKDFDKNKVLLGAIELFWHKGYNATSMDDLMETLGISRSSLYRAFTDKHTLFLKALAKYQQFSTAEIQAVIKDTDPPRLAIKKVLEFVTSRVTGDRKRKGCFMVNSEVEVGPHDKEVQKMVIANDEILENVLYKIIKKGQDSGELSSRQTPRVLARFLINNLKGIRVSAKSISDKPFFNGIIQTAIEALG